MRWGPATMMNGAISQPFALTTIQLRKIARRRGDLPAPKGFESFRLGLISNANSDFLVPALEASALRHGVWLDVTVTGMGHGIASILDPDSDLNRARPDAVLIAYTWHTLGAAAQTPGDTAGAAAAVDHLLEEIEMMAGMLAKAGTFFPSSRPCRRPRFRCSAVSTAGCPERCVQ